METARNTYLFDRDVQKCRAQTGEKLDKDRFRRDLGNVEGAYQEMARRLMGK